MQTNVCKRGVSAAGPRAWNYLPTNFRKPDLSHSHFKRLLKMLFTWAAGQC